MYRDKIDPELLKQLESHFAPMNAELAQILGSNFLFWAHFSLSLSLFSLFFLSSLSSVCLKDFLFALQLSFSLSPPEICS